jgi:hypothetical protein
MDEQRVYLTVIQFVYSESGTCKPADKPFPIQLVQIARMEIKDLPVSYLKSAHAVADSVAYKGKVCTLALIYWSLACQAECGTKDVL